jgi:hypothetical protein
MASWEDGGEIKALITMVCVFARNRLGTGKNPIRLLVKHPDGRLSLFR